MEKKIIKAKFNILHVQSQGVHFCMDLEFVKKVLPLVLFESIPGSAHYVAGLMNMAGRSIPVIDFGLCLGLNRNRPYSLSTPIVLCGDENREIGLIMDGVFGVTCIEKESLQMEEKFNNSSSPFLGTTLLGGNLALLIDMNEVLKIDLITTNPSLFLDGASE